MVVEIDAENKSIIKSILNIRCRDGAAISEIEGEIF